MKVVVATGIYPPDIGGPALYAAGVEASLKKLGHTPVLVLFGGLKKYPSGLRHLLYVFTLFGAARGADAIFAFDTYSVGVPAALVARLRGIPLVIRIGGDFVWETYVERTKKLIPLPHFYEKLPRLHLKERVAFALVRWMLSRAKLAFNTEWLLEIWQKPYGIHRERAHVVANVIGERLAPLASDNKVLLYGRTIAMKNRDAFARAFATAKKHGVALELETGQVTHKELLERMRSAYAVAVPSISEVAPNTIIDAIRCGKPFILSKYSGYAEPCKDLGVIVDPLDEESMAAGIQKIADSQEYARMQEHIRNFTEVRTFDDVTRELLALI